MTRVLLVGVGPMPRPDAMRVYATGLRLETFLKALVHERCEIALAEFSFGGANIEFVPLKSECIQHHVQLPAELDRAIPFLDTLILEFKPDCIVALTDVGALAVCGTNYNGPIHVDYFGHPMAERQQQGAAHRSDAALAEQWFSVLPVLLRADQFSVCSHDQRLALMGELGVAGRLNKETIKHLSFIHIVPPVLPFDRPLVLSKPDLLTDKAIPATARIILCSGGYNTWVDEETLFHGIEHALALDSNLHFVSTGGKIQGHVENIYERFENRVRNSKFADRMHLLGWVREEDFENILMLSHVGVNCDVQSFEGEVGCRNRLYGWLWAGVRVVTTVTSEPTRDLVDQGFATEVPFNDRWSLAKAIVAQAALGRRDDLPEFQDKIATLWGWENFFSWLLKWLEEPRPAPDRKTGKVKNPLADLQRQFLEFATGARTQNESVRDAKDLANRLAGSRAFQLYAAIHPDVRELVEKLSSEMD
ncbi:MAG: hypothetical protein ABI579_04785 [Candidatus Sumerlaeota bacterium]